MATIRARRRGRRWLLLLAVLAWPAGASGQAGTHHVRGRVVNRLTGAPVPGAEIFVLGRSRAAVSDSAGQFRQDRLPPGSYLIQVRRAGYVTMTWEVAATGDTAAAHLFRLQPVAVKGALGSGAAGPLAIQARVIDRDTRTPIDGAEVFVAGRPRAVLTDAMGSARHTGLAPTIHLIRVRKVGYEPVSVEVVASEDSAAEHVVELSRAGAPVMDTVVIEATLAEPGSYWLRDFERRRAERRGQFVTRSEIEQRNAASVGDLLRTLNGLRMLCNTRGCMVRMTRTNCRPEYFADGFPADASTVERMPVNDVFGVEVYDLFEVPVELQRPELRCGVIAVWTRRGPPPR